MTAGDLDAVRERYRALGSPGAGRLVTRFAPSPTGELHMGHVLHAEWVWGVARVLGARVLIRMEDHDRLRCRPEFERTIMDDLEWLGFAPDPASRASLERGDSPFRQSAHPERYQAAFDRLRAATDVYGCTCTRSMMTPGSAQGERRYPGTCRGMPVDRGRPAAVRARIPDGEVRAEDLRLGLLVQHPQRDQGDVAVRDAIGQWTYQYSVVVDDLHDGVNLVVRGEDLVASIGTQWLLAQLLGRNEPPVTVHHPLVRDAAGHKLSKRDRSETVRSLRDCGLPAEEVRARARAAAAAGTVRTTD